MLHVYSQSSWTFQAIDRGTFAICVYSKLDIEKREDAVANIGCQALPAH